MTTRDIARMHNQRRQMRVMRRTRSARRVVGVASLNRRQPAPPPEVPVAQTPAAVRVKAVERNPAAVVAAAALAAQADFLI